MIAMYKVGVVGDKDSVLAFKALGIDVYTPIGAKEIEKTVHRLAKESYGVIFITESLAMLIPDTLKEYEGGMIPSIVLIPNNRGTLNIGMDKINENMEKAVGTNIF